MINSSKTFLSLALVFLSLGLAWGAFEFGGWMGNWAERREFAKNQKPVIAKVAALEGQVKRKAFKGLQPELIALSQTESELRDLDTLMVESNSSAKIESSTGYSLQFGPGSFVILERWNQSDENSPLYLHLISGSLQVLQKGQRGSVFILHEGQLSYPEGFAPKAIRELIASSRFSLGDSAELPEDSKTQDAPESNPSPEAKDLNQMASSLQTLTDTYLDEVIGAQRLNFQKCQANAIRDGLNAKGEVIVGLQIAETGSIQELNLLRSNLNNEAFERCIQDVFSRIRFKSFKGGNIARSYPLTFE